MGIFDRRILAVVTAFVCTLGTGVAGLKVGDPAPALAVGGWVQGNAVTQFEGDKVYIVEFWATWCGPCVASIPHLNEIAMRYKDKGLVVIGQNVMEKDDKAVPAFITRMGGNMTYRVALDDKSNGNGRMAESWLKAAGQNGIPCAFVINKKGVIASIGHPMSLKEEMLEELLAEPSTAPTAGKESTNTAAASLAPEVEAMVRQAGAELAAGKLVEAESTITRLQTALAGNFHYIGGLLELELLVARKQDAKAVDLAKLLAEDNAENPAVITAMASRMVSRADISPALLGGAEKAVQPLGAVPGPQQAQALAISARIAMIRDNRVDAERLQARAIEVANQADRAAMETTLAAYRKGKLY